jgi:hypothetical protein
MERSISSLLNSQFLPFFILSGNAGSRSATVSPMPMPITPSTINSHRHGALPVSLAVRCLPMAYAMRPEKAPAREAVE